MGKLICGCNEAKEDCEQICVKFKNKRKPDKVFLIKEWPKGLTPTQRAIEYADKLDW
jgi:hypothetical protein